MLVFCCGICLIYLFLTYPQAPGCCWSLELWFWKCDLRFCCLALILFAQHCRFPRTGTYKRTTACMWSTPSFHQRGNWQVSWFGQDSLANSYQGWSWSQALLSLASTYCLTLLILGNCINFTINASIFTDPYSHTAFRVWCFFHSSCTWGMLF